MHVESKFKRLRKKVSISCPPCRRGRFGKTGGGGRRVGGEVWEGRLSSSIHPASPHPSPTYVLYFIEVTAWLYNSNNNNNNNKREASSKIHIPENQSRSPIYLSGTWQAAVHSSPEWENFNSGEYVWSPSKAPFIIISPFPSCLFCSVGAKEGIWVVVKYSE